MSKTITVGVVGCGYWGPNLIRNFRSLPECRLKSMCDLSKDRLKHLKSIYPEVEASTDFESLVRDPELNAIVIATAVRFHYSMAKAAIQAGKHTFIEKPMAASAAECEELIQLAKENGVTLMIGHTFLYSPAVKKVKEVISEGKIGDLRYISSRRLNLGLFQKDINVTWDLAPHDISIVLHVLEDAPISVNCRGHSHMARGGVEDVTTLCLMFKTGKFVTIQNSWLDPRKVREMTFVGTKQMIVYDDVEPREKIKIYDARVEVPPHYDTFAEFQYAYHYGDIWIPYIKQEEPLKVECQHFLDCIRSGALPISSGAQGLQMVRILEAASASLKQGGAAVDLSKSSS